MVKFQPDWKQQLVKDLPLWAVYSSRGGEKYLKVGKRFEQHYWEASVHLRSGEVLRLEPTDTYAKCFGVLEWEE